MPIPLAPLAERFRARLVSGEPNACWTWTGQSNSAGYGVIREAGAGSKKLQAHRVSWELTNGRIPDGLLVLHRCDNPSCVNPAHLFVGTQLDNMRDMVAKGRQNPHNALKTHCLRGHDFSAANTAVHLRQRACRTCKREQMRQYRARRAA